MRSLLARLPLLLLALPGLALPAPPEGARVLVEVLPSGQVEEERTIDSELTGAVGKDITYKTAGDYTLVSVPWARGGALTFNDSTASTLSTVGNAALFLGGLYLLSGFPAAAALADPFGFSRRLGVASPARPRHRFQHRAGGDEGFMKGLKLEAGKPARKQHNQQNQQKHHKQQKRPSKAPRKQQTATLAGKKRPQAAERQQRPRFRLPSLPTLRMPQLPRLRRPTFPRLPQFNNPLAPRPRPAQPQAAPRPPPRAAPRPAPQAAPRPRPQTSTQAAPMFRPSTFASTPILPVSPRAPVTSSQRPAPLRSAPLRLPVQPAPAPALGGGDFSPFGGSDPFSEFQAAGFGPDEDSFRNLINNQFGSTFDSQRLPSRR